jgi:uncharacterized membrane protein YoaK (UPF0700 family)
MEGMRQSGLRPDGALSVGTDGDIVRLASSLTNSALLALAGGFLDAFTYLAHGHVFANAMTGNVVLLGINCFSGSLGQGLRHLPPIIMFLLGVTAAKWLDACRTRRWLGHPHLVALMIQIALLAALALLPQTAPDVWFTTSIAFGASVQVQSFRRVHGRSYNSTFTTGNLRTFAESCFDWLVGEGDDEMRRASWDFGVICLSFFTGAAIGGFATIRLGNHALWLDIALLTVVMLRVWPRSKATAA